MIYKNSFAYDMSNSALVKYSHSLYVDICIRSVIRLLHMYTIEFGENPSLYMSPVKRNYLFVNKKVQRDYFYYLPGEFSKYICKYTCFIHYVDSYYKSESQAQYEIIQQWFKNNGRS